jgi:hypothetical protein
VREAERTACALHFRTIFCEKNLPEQAWGVAQSERHIPSAAKAAVDFVAVAARLKPCPFKTKFKPGYHSILGEEIRA